MAGDGIKNNDWTSALIRDHRTIHDAVELLTANSLRIVLVVDEHKRLQGTVTDGDIRRALISGYDLSSEITSIMHVNPTTTTSTVSRRTALNTMRVTNAVDERGKRVMITPDIMVVPGGMEFTARTVMESVLLPGGTNNDANVVRGSLARGVLSWNALSDAASASAWWIGQAGQGIRCYDSGAPVIEVKEKENGDIVVQSRYYFGAAVTNWRYWYAANKADS